MSTPTTSTSTAPVNRHAPTAVEKQRTQLERLLKDPAKPAFVPAAPKEKTIRPAREMMKNVQGSSAGAGSGEFHVYKASRRREYERLKLLDEKSQKEVEDAEFEKKRKEAEAITDAKTAKNRAKRQKKKERSTKPKGAADDTPFDSRAAAATSNDLPIKKRRLVNGKELVFRQPGEDSDDEGQHRDESDSDERSNIRQAVQEVVEQPIPQVAEEAKLIIHDD